MADSHQSGKSSSTEDTQILPLHKLRELADTPVPKSLVSILGEDAKLFLVGGAVRDALLSLPVRDLDFATALRPDELKKRLNDAGIRTVDTGLEHGTITALIDEEPVEITTFRLPGDRTTNNYSETIEEDLEGRDFTINAIAFSLNDQELVDPFNGWSDLQEKRLNGVSNPKSRFEEDPLRIMRMVRFGPGENRTVGDETLHAAKATAHKLALISPERIREELNHILISDSPRDGLLMLQELSLFEAVLPELLPSIGFEQNEFHSEDVFQHTLTVIENTPKDLLLRLVALFHDLGKPATLSIDEEGRRHFYTHEEVSDQLCKTAMSRLRYSKRSIEETSTLVRYHMRPLTCGPSGVRRLMRDLGPLLEPWLIFKKADAEATKMPPDKLKGEIEGFQSLLSTEEARQVGPAYGKLRVSGDDLKAIGFSEGKALGVALKALEEIVIEDPEMNTREILLREAKKLL